MTTHHIGRKLACDFCGKGKDETRRLISGPRVYICSECVGACVKLLEEDAEKELMLEAKSPPAPFHTE